MNQAQKHLTARQEKNVPSPLTGEGQDGGVLRQAFHPHPSYSRPGRTNFRAPARRRECTLSAFATTPPRPPSRRRGLLFVGGFTLIELLVAIGIFALISAIAYGSLARLMEDRASLQAEQEFWRALSLSFMRMEEDFAQARERSMRDVIGFTQPAFRGQPTDTRALAAPNVEFIRGGVLTLSDGARSDLQRVAYRLDEGTLKRLTWPVLDLGPQTEPTETPLLSAVEEFRVRFYAPSGAWLDVWPADGINETLPRGVEVKITLKGRGEFTRLFMVNG